MIETLGKVAVQQSSFVKIIFNNPLPILESGNATVFLGQKFCYFPEILAIRSFQSSKEFSFSLPHQFDNFVSFTLIQKEML